MFTKRKIQKHVINKKNYVNNINNFNFITSDMTHA